MRRADGMELSSGLADAQIRPCVPERTTHPAAVSGDAVAGHARSMARISHAEPAGRRCPRPDSRASRASPHAMQVSASGANADSSGAGEKRRDRRPSIHSAAQRRSAPRPVQRPAPFNGPSLDSPRPMRRRSCTSAGQTSRGQGAGMNSGIPSKSSPAHSLPMPPCFASRDLPATCRVTSDRRHVRQLLLETAIFGLTVVVRSGLSQVVPGCGFATVGASDGALRAWLGRLLL
jgi:hypothetical protein